MSRPHDASRVSPTFRINLTIHSATELMVCDSNGKSDPFVKFVYRGEERKTQVKTKSLSPVWQESFVIDYNADTDKPILTFEVWDWDRIGSNDFMGKVDIDLSQLKPGNSDGWYPVWRKDKKAGKMRLVFQLFAPEGTIPVTVHEGPQFSMQPQYPTGPAAATGYAPPPYPAPVYGYQAPPYGAPPPQYPYGQPPPQQQYPQSAYPPPQYPGQFGAPMQQQQQQSPYGSPPPQPYGSMPSYGGMVPPYSGTAPPQGYGPGPTTGYPSPQMPYAAPPSYGPPGQQPSPHDPRT